jgi:hypothetical protein
MEPLMVEAAAPGKPLPRKWNWRVPTIVLIPFYLMLAGFMLRYAVYARTSDHWGFTEYLRALCVYDCNAYERLALYGYEGRPSGFDKGDANNWAFFPLFSILSWASAKVTGVSVLVAGSVLANLITVWAAVVAWPLFEGKLRAYFLFCFFLFVGPVSYYYTTPYTEALFLLLTVAALVLLKQRDYIAAGFTGAFMTATRSTGLILVFAILIQALTDHRKDGGTVRSFFAGIFKRTDLMLAIALVPVGLCCLALYLYFHSGQFIGVDGRGDALAFVHIQRAWGRAFQNPFGNLWLALSGQYKSGWTWSIGTELAFGLAAIGGLVFALVMAIRKQWAWAVFTAFGVLLPLSTNTYSMIRFVSGLAPVLIVGALLLARWKWLFYVSLAVFLILDVLLLPTWIARTYYLM